MKLAIAGKGGAGKTSITGTLARLIARRGRRVLVIDNDLNPNLSLTLGIPAGRMSSPPSRPGSCASTRRASTSSRCRCGDLRQVLGGCSAGVGDLVGGVDNQRNEMLIGTEGFTTTPNSDIHFFNPATERVLQTIRDPDGS